MAIAITGIRAVWRARLLVCAAALCLGGWWLASWNHAREVRARIYKIGADHAPPYYFLKPGAKPEGLAVDLMNDAARRAQELRADLTARGVHPDVLRFCRAELVADNYFHAVLEATKSIADKLRFKTGLTDDGGPLVDAVLTGNPPMLAINDSEIKILRFWVQTELCDFAGIK